MQITFDQLPEAVNQLSIKMENIERLLMQWSKPTTTQQSEDLLTIQQAADFLRLSITTIYGFTSRNEIPSMKKGKRLYFSKDELTTWIKQGKRMTAAEIESEADVYLNSKKKGRA
ncbi:MAG: helix-turn-helix domain-containing protein [Ferruginibacter sp.]